MRKAKIWRFINEIDKVLVDSLDKLFEWIGTFHIDYKVEWNQDWSSMEPTQMESQKSAKSLEERIPWRHCDSMKQL